MPLGARTFSTARRPASLGRSKTAHASGTHTHTHTKRHTNHPFGSGPISETQMGFWPSTGHVARHPVHPAQMLTRNLVMTARPIWADTRQLRTQIEASGAIRCEEPESGVFNNSSRTTADPLVCAREISGPQNYTSNWLGESEGARFRRWLGHVVEKDGGCVGAFSAHGIGQHMIALSGRNTFPLDPYTSSKGESVF